MDESDVVSMVESMRKRDEAIQREMALDMRAMALTMPFVDRDFTDEEQDFLDERRGVWAERDRRAEERDAEERHNAMTVGELIEVLRGMPEDAPVQVDECYSWGPEHTWAGEHHVVLRKDGSVFIGG